MDNWADFNKLTRGLGRKRRGFTLLESLVALYLLTYGIVGALTISQQGLMTSSVIRNQLVAANLAREGIELVHNKRASNMMQARDIDCLRAPDYLQCISDLSTSTGGMADIVSKCSTANGGCVVWWGYNVGGTIGNVSNANLEFINCDSFGGTCPKLKLGADNVYSYDSAGSDTIFRRTIYVDKNSGGRDEWVVRVKVEWNGKFGAKSLEAQTYLSSWM